MDVEVHTLEETLPWGVDRIDAELVWNGAEDGCDVTPGRNAGAGAIVAIIDTGLDKDHPDLAANIAGGRNFVGWSRVDPDAWDDDNGHGTHCGGIVAAVDNEEGVIGVAPEASLYGVKVLDRRGSGYVSDIIAGIEWAVENGADIISMSLGTTSDVPSLDGACDAAWNNGVLLVAAAGNEEGSPVIYPAAYSSVIAVSATNSDDNLASFSSTGPEVELAAPGVNIYSTYKKGGYAIKSGTSMACPHVAGTAALAIGNVRQCLQDTAEDLGDLGFDTKYGHGLVDAEVAAGSAVTLELIAVTPETATIPKGLTRQYMATGTYSDASTADITSSVAWTSSATAVATINSEGLATGVGEGTTEITATLDSVVSDTATLTVTAPILQSITVMPNTATIEVDAKQQYMATGTYSDDSTAHITSSVAWASSDTTVASIDSEGLATGVGEGSTDITATSDSISDTATLTVTLALKSIAVTPETASIPKGLTQQYMATGTYSDDSTANITSSVAWESSDTTVATIDSKGLATGVGEGSTEITATLGLIRDTAALTVTAPSEPTVVIVESINYSTEGGKNQDRHLCIAVALLDVDNPENPVADASVSIEVYRGESPYVTYTGTTGTDGTVTFKKNNAPSGTYTTTVTAVTAGELTWDGITPEKNSFIKD
ncbi:Tk-subtilisin [ANME-1 cluster archaeon GoMg3.2]|nr:Tk-subtilisin [ANME-1 cluster archaeon GoMg3.2]